MPSVSALNTTGKGPDAILDVVTFICAVIAVLAATSSFKLIKITAGLDGLIKAPSANVSNATLVMMGPAVSESIVEAVGNVSLSRPAIKPSEMVIVSAVPPKKADSESSGVSEFSFMSIAREPCRVTDVTLSAVMNFAVVLSIFHAIFDQLMLAVVTESAVRLSRS